MLKVLKKNRAEKGFTLVELIIITGIISVLSTIAIPQFKSYRTKSYNASAKADLRNAAAAQEGYFIDNWKYSSTLSALTGPEFGLYVTENVNLNIISAGANSYEIIAYHSLGNVSYTLTGPGGKMTH
jgi:Tfp pilus assembly protein PilE